MAAPQRGFWAKLSDIGSTNMNYNHKTVDPDVILMAEKGVEMANIWKFKMADTKILWKIGTNLNFASIYLIKV